MNILPSEILKDAESALSKLIPGKSKDRYLKGYELFQEWKKNRNVAVVTEDVMLAFFYQKSEVFKSSTLWSCYSMLKSTLNLYENVDISKYTKLTSFLKQNSVGYQPKKAKILTREQVDRFMIDASDEKYLMIKVATLIGIAGACRREELHKMCIEDIEQHGSVLVVNLRNTKTNRPRVFTIVGDGVVNQIAIIKKYIALRPKKVTHNKLFLFYNKGKCSVQPVGIHTFAKMPKVIAEYLNLPDPNEYSGHCFRRTSATLLADSGADLTTLKRHGGWRSSSVAEGYIEDSIENKIKIAKRIAVGEGSLSSLRTTVFEGDLSKHNSEAASAYRAELLNQNSDAAFVHGVTFSNLQSCTINVNISK